MYPQYIRLKNDVPGFHGEDDEPTMLRKGSIGIIEMPGGLHGNEWVELADGSAGSVYPDDYEVISTPIDEAHIEAINTAAFHLSSVKTCEAIFGETTGRHIWTKYRDHYDDDFILLWRYLDLANRRTLLNYVNQIRN